MKNGHLPCWKKPSLLAVTSHLQRCWHLSVHHIETKAMYQHQAMIRKWPPMEPFGSTAIFRRICNCSKLGGAIISIYLQYLSIYLSIYLPMYVLLYYIIKHRYIYMYVWCQHEIYLIMQQFLTKLQRYKLRPRSTEQAPTAQDWKPGTCAGHGHDKFALSNPKV
jgi:hypothetical protein